MPLTATLIGETHQIGRPRQANGGGKFGIKRGNQHFGEAARRGHAFDFGINLRRSLTKGLLQPGDGVRRDQDCGRGNIQVDPQTDVLTCKHLHHHPTGQRRVGDDLACKLGQPVFAVEHQRKGAVGCFKQRRRNGVALGFLLQHQEQFTVRQPFIKSQARSVVLRCGLHGGVAGIQWGLLRHAITSCTRARRTGSSSASNQGFRFSHAVLRQDGCGKGKSCGAWSRHCATRA